ncbi:MAG TPA: nitrilase-related carbon-nitrogen hydrolase, partial [Synergistales bacterium]|nr:nitrilase-related carbon-nitrogen hydrolase [Synergistales bacterium]
GVVFDAGRILASSRGSPPLSASDIVGTRHGNFAFVHGEGILLPEYARSLTLLGADLMFSLTDSLSGPSLEIARTRAYENKVFLVRSASPGEARRSFICDPYGRILSSAFIDGEQVFGCQVELLSARCKEVVPGTDVIRGRRPCDYRLLCR